MEPSSAATVVTLTGYGETALVADVIGDPGGIPVLLLHGGGQTRASWGQAGSMLAEHGYRALAMDLRGHGESAWAADQDYTPAALVGDLEAVRRFVGRPLVLVGASLGGLASMLYAAAHPDDVEALVLVDVTARNSAAGQERIRRFLSADPDGFASFEEVVAAVRAYKGRHFDERDTSRLHLNVRTREDGRLVWHWDPAFLLRDGRSWTHGKDDVLTSAADRLQVPTLLLVGGDTDVVDEQALADFERRVPALETEVIPGASHMIASDENSVFGRALLRWLERRVDPAVSP